MTTTSLEQTTALQLAAARSELQETAARAELAVLAAIEAQAATEAAKLRVSRMSRALAILRGEEPEPLPAPSGPAPALEGPPAPRQSVAEQAAAAAARGDPLANRRPVSAEDAGAPPPANRPQSGPMCPACGSYGTLQRVLKSTDKGSFMVISCSSCGSEKPSG